MTQTAINYTLTADDMAAFNTLLKLQADVGPGARYRAGAVVGFFQVN